LAILVLARQAGDCGNSGALLAEPFCFSRKANSSQKTCKYIGDAVGRKSYIAIIALAFFLAEAQYVGMSKAESLDLNQPRIVLHSPNPRQVYNSSSIDLNLEILKPSSWFVYGWFYKPSSSSSGIPFDPRDLAKGYGCIGRIDYLECTLDSNTVQTFPTSDNNPFVYSEYPLSTKLPFSQRLSVLEGKHTLKITVFGSYATDSYYPNGSRIYQIVNASVETSFSVWYTSPKLSLLSPQSQMYNESEVPLIFEVNRPTVCSYSLDGAGNYSLAGNTTLTEIAEGQHSIVIYAKDPAGNEGKSDTVFFNVVLPTPSPSFSATREPSIEPTQTATPTNGDNQTLNLTPIIVLSGIVVVAVAVGALVIFMKRRCQL
jgi:hypothetical protein